MPEGGTHGDKPYVESLQMSESSQEPRRSKRRKKAAEQRSSEVGEALKPQGHSGKRAGPLSAHAHHCDARRVYDEASQPCAMD